MRDELRLALEDIAKDSDSKVVIITGAGRAFCAGGDVKEQGAGFDAISGRERIRHLHRTLMTMVNMEKPIIAMVNGLAVGAGFNLALACDMIFASDDAKFSQVFINIGFITDFGGLYFLPRLIGLARAKELVFTGRMIGAQEAKDIGLVNQVFPKQELEDAVINLARTMAGKSAKALAFDKSLLNRSLDSDLITMLEMEQFAQGICFQSEEHKEALGKLLNRNR